MRVDSEFIRALIESEKAYPIVANRMLGIWLSKLQENQGEFYYKGETEAKEFEELLLNSFNEFFFELARTCANEPSQIGKNDETSYVVMDGMSLREGVLIYDRLKKEGYETRIKCGLSAVPSDTHTFREKLNLSMKDFKEVKNHKNIQISGDERLVWSCFPDIMLDKIQVGHTVISSLGEMYDITEKIVKALIKKLKADRIVVLSDHGYIRSEAGFVYTVSGKARERLQEVFGSKRFVPMDDVDLADMIAGGYVIECGGFYVVKSRYVWPVSGRYSIYLHGGLSLMECLTPILEIKNTEK